MVSLSRRKSWVVCRSSGIQMHSKWLGLTPVLLYQDPLSFSLVKRYGFAREFDNINLKRAHGFVEISPSVLNDLLRKADVLLFYFFNIRLCLESMSLSFKQFVIVIIKEASQRYWLLSSNITFVSYVDIVWEVNSEMSNDLGWPSWAPVWFPSSALEHCSNSDRHIDNTRSRVEGKKYCSALLLILSSYPSCTALALNLQVE